MARVLLVLVGLPWLLFFFSEALGEERPIMVKMIDVAGARRIDPGTVRSRIKSREGGRFSVETVREDIAALYSTGYFQRVEVESEGFEGGVRLTYRVEERPFLIDIQFEGNTSITKETLSDKILFKSNRFLDDLKVKEEAEKIRKMYEDDGFYSAGVTPVVRRLTEGRATLVFVIREGERAYVKRIDFEGNRALSRRDLKKSLSTSEYFWLTSWLTESGRFKKEQVEGDAERLREVYLDSGYLQVQVGAGRVTLADDKRWFFLSFPIVEGPQFAVQKISFSGNRLFTDAEIRLMLILKEGEEFSRAKLRRDIQEVIDRYGDRGYAFASVDPQITPDERERVADVKLFVSEGEQVTVRHINISGNDKTRDKVIRREVRLSEQELWNTSLLRRSFQRLNNLNFFETIDMTPRSVGPGEVDLNIRVKEKPTGSFSLGGGYSSIDRFMILTQLSQGNLFGRGELLRARTEFGARRKDFTLTFREPYLFDYEVSATTDLFNNVRSFDSYKEHRVGGGLALGKQFTEYVSGSVTYTLESLKIFEVDFARAPEIAIRQEARGKTITSSLGFSLARDTRDFFFDPSRGSRYSASIELAGTVLGGDNDYYRTIGDASKYFPLWWDHVGVLHARIGYAEALLSQELPIGERFFVGGINTVRGFNFGRAGPQSTTGQILGGNKELFFNAEYLFPIVREAKLKGVLFADAGRAFDDPERIDLGDLRQSFGGGIRWITPIGPLRLEYGRKIHPKEGESVGELEFSIGTLF